MNSIIKKYISVLLFAVLVIPNATVLGVTTSKKPNIIVKHSGKVFGTVALISWQAFLISLIARYGLK